MMNMKKNYLCCVIENSRLSSNIYSLIFDCPEIADTAKAGQFVHIECGAEHILRRPLSICDTDGEMVRVVYEVKGSGTEWLSRRKSGDIIDVLGALGNGFRTETHERVLLAGGGIGAAPLLLAARQNPGASVVMGFKNAEQIILLREFALHCRSAEISTDDGSSGKKGFVTDLLRTRLEMNCYDMILACGPPPMLHAVSAAACDYNIPCQVSMEQRMACGVGACLVCSCSTIKGYKRICADGPVFNAEEVVWNES